VDEFSLPAGSLIYPGSFNPLHSGHISLVTAALSSYPTGTPPPLIIFEIAVVNVDKPPLPVEEVLTRLKQFDLSSNPLFQSSGCTNVAVVLTSVPLFLQKSKIFNGCSFLVGADTFSRIINPKYYINKNEQNQEEDQELNLASRELQSAIQMVAALSIINENRCRFIVGGRINKSIFETKDSILKSSNISYLLTKEVRQMFMGLSEEQFRADISSTAIRVKSNGK
jgi:phosphopantetheine adenylyltransferase